MSENQNYTIKVSEVLEQCSELNQVYNIQGCAYPLPITNKKNKIEEYSEESKFSDSLEDSKTVSEYEDD